MSSRLLIAILVIFSILSTTAVLIQFARGYRPDFKNGQIKPTGLLVATSEPKGAQVFIDNELITATDDTLTLDPGTYHVELRKDGFISWTKQLRVEKELVTQTDAFLFPSAPDLQSVTKLGAVNPVLSPNGTKLLFVIPEATTSATTPAVAAGSRLETKTGIWLLELENLPLGFNRDPKQLVIGQPTISSTLTPNTPLDWSEAQFIWSPDSSEVLALFYPTTNESTRATPTPTPRNTKDQLETGNLKLEAAPTVVYRFKTTNSNLPATQLTSSITQYEKILSDWQLETQRNLETQLSNLPPQLASLLATHSAQLQFSPDETKLLYTATSSAQLLDQYISPVPSASTQPQARLLQPNHTYLYDLKEDRNFQILDERSTQAMTVCSPLSPSAPPLNPTHSKCPKLMWFPTSRHLVYFTDNKISIMEYDSTNNQVIYAGPIEHNFVFPHPSPNKLLLATTLNPDAFPLPNLYSISLR